MTSRRRASETQALLSLRCPACAESLSVVTGVHRLTFHCPRAHAFNADRLLRRHSGDARRALESVVAAWQQKSEVLKEVARRARRDGYADVAVTFDREAERADQRLATLRRDVLADGGTPGADPD